MGEGTETGDRVILTSVSLSLDRIETDLQMGHSTTMSVLLIGVLRSDLRLRPHQLPGPRQP